MCVSLTHRGVVLPTFIPRILHRRFHLGLVARIVLPAGTEHDEPKRLARPLPQHPVVRVQEVIEQQLDPAKHRHEKQAAIAWAQGLCGLVNRQQELSSTRSGCEHRGAVPADLSQG